jgi:FkbM family methyltransferase
MQVMQKIRRKFNNINGLVAQQSQQIIPWEVVKSPRLRMMSYQDKIDCLFYSLTITKKNVFFVQVGSNDGNNGDPLRHFILDWKWSGIMIEPLQFVFKRLKHNYDNYQNITLENVAISSDVGVKNFYHLKECNDLPVTYDQLGSFSLETVLKNSTWIPDIQERIINSPVNCITFNELCQKHKVKEIDILHIDTEGYDFEIIKMIDFYQAKPKIILYEHKHLSAEDKNKCQLYLSNNNYELLELRRDTIALEKEAKANNLKLCIAWNTVCKSA